MAYEAVVFILRRLSCKTATGCGRNKADYYHTSGGAITNFGEKLPAPQSKLAQAITKETYDFGFISLPDDYEEEQLELALERQLTRFLLELGTGFAYLGRQRQIVVAGKLNLYVNAVDDLIKTPSQNPTIGLLICSNKDETEVQYAFKGVQTPMGVASYDNIQIKQIQEQLPSVEELKARIRLLEEELNKEK